MFFFPALLGQLPASAALVINDHRCALSWCNVEARLDIGQARRHVRQAGYAEVENEKLYEAAPHGVGLDQLRCPTLLGACRPSGTRLPDGGNDRIGCCCSNLPRP